MEIDETTGRPILDEFEQKQRTDYITGLRSLLDFYESRPNMPAANPWIPTEVWVMPNNKEELQAIIRTAGSLEKKGSIRDDSMELRREFSANIVLRIIIDKQKTCERVKVGEEVVEAQPERIIPATEEKVVDVYEWKCEPILSSPAVGTAEAAGIAMDEAMQPVVVQ